VTNTEAPVTVGRDTLTRVPNRIGGATATLNRGRAYYVVLLPDTSRTRTYYWADHQDGSYGNRRYATADDKPGSVGGRIWALVLAAAEKGLVP
jgi:hypothetical protein